MSDPVATKVRATSAEEAVIVRKLERLKVRHQKATEALQSIEDERAAAYVEARAAGLTFRKIAAIFGITEAAIMQKIKRIGEG